MEYKIPLLPAKARYIGWALIVVAAVFAYLYFWGGKPDFFKVKVFALASLYLEKTYCAIIQTNLLDELAAVLLERLHPDHALYLSHRRSLQSGGAGKGAARFCGATTAACRARRAAS